MTTHEHSPDPILDDADEAESVGDHWDDDGPATDEVENADADVAEFSSNGQEDVSVIENTGEENEEDPSHDSIGEDDIALNVSLSTHSRSFNFARERKTESTKYTSEL